MIGRSGSTQGDRTDKAPARNARPRVPRLMTCALERTFQERFDVAWIRLADRAGDFLGALAQIRVLCCWAFSARTSSV